jgi:WD40 repeat protein
VRSVAFSPDGKLLASAGSDHRIVLWELPQGRAVRSWKAHEDMAHDVVFTPDSRTLVSVGNADRVAKLWDVASGAEKARRPCPSDLLSVALSPDGKTAAMSGYGNTVSFWSTVDPGEPGIDLPVPFSVRALAFAPSGSQLVATGDTEMFRVWDVGAGGRDARPVRIVRCGRGKGRAAVFARQGALLVTATEEDGTVQFWDPMRLGGCEDISPLSPHVMDVALSPDGRGASAHWLGEVCLLDLANRRVDRTLLVPPESHARDLENKQRTAGPNAVAFSPDGRTVAAGCADHRARLWDVASGRQLLALDHGAWVRAVAFSPTERLIATAGHKGEVRLWELPSGARHATFATRSNESYCLAFAADGRTLAAGGGDFFGVNLWDPSLATPQGRLTDRSSTLVAASRVEAVAFSADGATLAAGCSDGDIRLWDIASGDLRRTFSGHVGTVIRLAFAPDGRTLASLGEDHVLNLWHLATGQRLFSLDTHAHELCGLALSADGRLLVAGERLPGDAGPSALLMWRAEPEGP